MAAGYDRTRRLFPSPSIRRKEESGYRPADGIIDSFRADQCTRVGSSASHFTVIEKTMKPKSIIVIGAGVGGIVAATHLARRGLNVTVLEKNSHAGGRCDRFSRDGHHFDAGPTLMVMPLLYEAEFAALGTCLHEMLDLQRVDPTYHLVFDDGS